jgi:hypothetical protein
MKYIVVLIEGKEAIFVFPKCIDHDRFHESLAAIRFGPERDWRRHVLGCPSELVSAGFVDGGRCHGRSETLRKESRGAVDTALLGGAA